MSNGAKAKGRKGQQEVAALLLSYVNKKWPGEYSENDFRSRPMGSPGDDIMLSPAVSKILPLDIEVKRRKEATHIRWLRASESRAFKSKAKVTPVLLCRQDHEVGEWYATIKAEILFKLLLEGHL